MSDSQLKAWVKRSREVGLTDSEIMKQLRAHGWGEKQIRGALYGDHRTKIIQQSRLRASSAGLDGSNVKMWISAAFIFVIIIAGSMYFILSGDSFWSGNNTVANTNTYVYTGETKTLDEQLALQSTIGQFSDYDELRTFLEERITDSSSGYYGYGNGGFARSDLRIVEEIMPTSAIGDAGLKSGPDYSTTNIQVAGVDESDIVKTDGTYIYIVANSNIYIIDGYPAGEAAILSTIVLESSPQNIYINGNYLVVYGAEDYLYEKPYYDSIRVSNNYTYLKVFDITDKVNPKQVRDMEFEGYYVNSRMIGDYVYFITSQYAYNIEDDYPIPMVIEDEELLPIDPTMPRCNCPDIYYIDAPYEDYVFTTVTAINVKNNNEAIASDAYLIGSSDNMYVSQDNIYLVYTKYISEYQLTVEVWKESFLNRLSARDQEKVMAIEKTANYILSPGEKLSKIAIIFNSYQGGLSAKESLAFEEEMAEKIKEKYNDISKELEKTVIHKISVNKNKLTYQGSGEVTGHVLNQFSMDETDGYFRIATTKGRTWSRFGLAEDDGTWESYSNVYVLDGNLEVVGKIEGLAKTEQIYSARFMQGRVYLVTFRQTDPLYAIDLQDPTSPRVLGELKVPGFSSYLHPYDENLLIGFGKQATESGVVQGLKLSLFDVSDVSNMKEIDTYEMGDSGSDSVALSDHKAFLFSKDKNLLVVPVTLGELEEGEPFSYRYTHGAMVFNITPDGIEFRQRIDHSDGSDDDSNSKYYYDYYYYDTAVKRSLYIKDMLYTLSAKYLKMNNLSDLAEVKSITLLTPGDSGVDFNIVR